MKIAIPAATSLDTAYNLRSAPDYASAVTRSGGEPVAIDITLPADEILSIALTCDGILLPGSPADVDPALYGQERDPATAPTDAPRETADHLLLDHAARTGKPVLAICFGLQTLNVWSGGSLIQDLTPLPVNHAAGSKVAIAHTALIAPESVLAGLLTPEEAPLSGDFLRLPINTSHHQAVAIPGENLRIVARCPDDGVIEALELESHARMVPAERVVTPPAGELFHVEQLHPLAQPDSHPGKELFHVEQLHSRPQFVLGVQWHPERTYDISPASRALFDRLISEAKIFAAGRLK